MESTIPNASDLVARIAPLSNAQLQRLADLSGVPFTTLWKIRAGETSNPRINTAADLWPHIDAAAREAA